ncbi:MAG: pirin family protein [Phycisphaerales bacterium]
MITIRHAHDRGHSDLGWLDSRHSFSFGEYRDPANMGFRSLRVINDDRVAPGAGFGTHGHRDMEIISIVLEGGLEHRDSMGNGEILRPGEVQVMSAGTGVRHSEFNASKTDPVHFLQVWIMPDRAGHPPRYQQRAFPAPDRAGRLVRVAGPRTDGQSAGDAADSDGALAINQDAAVYLGSLKPGDSARHTLAPGRAAWVHVISGNATVSGKPLKAGDAVAIDGEPGVEITGAESGAEVLLFDLA